MQPEDGMGLVCAGGVSQSFLARMPALLRYLGPIKTSSFRVSRQTANSLRAGYAASHYSALEPCRLILVAAPEAALERILRDMVARTPIRKAPFSRNMVVLCGCVRDSLAPSPLHGTGARVASLNLIPESREQIFVAEGHPYTVRCLRTLFAESHLKIITLKPGTKPLFFAGIQASATLLLPWSAAAMASLRAAGFSRPEAAMVGEILGSGRSGGMPRPAPRRGIARPKPVCAARWITIYRPFALAIHVWRSCTSKASVLRWRNFWGDDRSPRWSRLRPRAFETRALARDRRTSHWRQAAQVRVCSSRTVAVRNEGFRDARLALPKVRGWRPSHGRGSEALVEWRTPCRSIFRRRSGRRWSSRR